MRKYLLILAAAAGCAPMQRAIHGTQDQADLVRYAVLDEAVSNWPQTTVICLSFGDESIGEQHIRHLQTTTATVLRRSECGDWRSEGEVRFEHYVAVDLAGVDIQGESATTRYSLETRGGGGEAFLVSLVRDDAGDWRVIKKQGLHSASN